MEEIKLDILAFGAHADDVEIGMGGTLAKYAKMGKKIGICDLTQAELSSNGTVSIRIEEANKAAQMLGVAVRENLGFPDRGLLLAEEYIQKIVAIIRQYQPTIIFSPYEIDRHPDHGNCTKIIKEAYFSAGIRKYSTAQDLQAYRPKALYFYMINGFHKPDFVVNISDEIEIKKRSLEAYESQFQKGENSFDTPLVNNYIESVVAREKLFGKEVGINFAEGFKVHAPIILHRDLLGEEE